MASSAVLCVGTSKRVQRYAKPLQSEADGFRYALAILREDQRARDRFTLKIIGRIMKLLTLPGYIIEVGFHPCRRFPATTELRSGPGRDS